MAKVFSNKNSALNVHLKGTIGKFRVSSSDGNFNGVEARYLLTHVTLSDQPGQSQLLSMLAPVREVFDIQQLDFDEIMQRDIDDARVSLELIPYLLDTSTTGLIKLFPPIVAVALPLKPNSRIPDTNYRKRFESRTNSSEHAGIIEERITAGLPGEEQFEFLQYYQDDRPLYENGELSLASHSCTLAIVDGQHRAMALLALYRNLTGDWTDAKRSAYARYYKVWPDKEIRTFNLSELQLPVLICTFPTLDGTHTQDIDVVRAARRVFLTLNKTAKKVSDSRNKLLNDQDIVAECLRATLSHIKTLGLKDDTGLRIWNIELDQEGDRVKIVSSAAFSGVNHLYHFTEQILMNNPARGIEARGKGGARKRLDEAYVRLDLKDELNLDQRTNNIRTNYSDEIAEIFRKKWSIYYIPIIEKIFNKLHPFTSFSRATIKLKQELENKHDTELEKILFDGQATSRTFDDFREGLNRRVQDKEPNWTTPEIRATLNEATGLFNKRKENVDSMKNNRASFLLESVTDKIGKQVNTQDGVVKPVKEAIDRMYENVFSTVAFQTAVICTYVEAIQSALGSIKNSTPELLDEYIDAINSLLKPKNINCLKALLQTFEGGLEISDTQIKIVPGAPTFREVVLPGELQPAEWPKYRYLLLEVWKSTTVELQNFIDEDTQHCRASVAKSLYARKINDYCKEKRIDEAGLNNEEKLEVLIKSQTMFEEFLTVINGKKIKLKKELFERSRTENNNNDIEISLDNGDDENI